MTETLWNEFSSWIKPDGEDSLYALYLWDDTPTFLTVVGKHTLVREKPLNDTGHPHLWLAGTADIHFLNWEAAV